MAACEVHAGSEGDHGQLGAFAVREGEQSVRDLVQRSVAADGDDLLGAVGRGLRDQFGEVPGLLGEERRAVEAQLRGAVGQLRPAPTRRPVVRRRVDEEDALSDRR
jgi:hypothetical protein